MIRKSCLIFWVVSFFLIAGLVCAGSPDEDILVSKNISGNYWTSIDGDRVVWLSQYDSYDEHAARADAKYRIIVHNITSGEETLIPVFSSRPENPGISERYVVWSDSVPGGSTAYDIYYHDLESGITKTATTEYGDQKNPVVAGNIIIWNEYFGPGKKNSRISIYNISDQSLSNLEFVSPKGTVADTDGKNILFSVCNETSYSIYLYNISKEEKTLVYQGSGSVWLSISGDNVGWIEHIYRGEDPAFYKRMFYNISSCKIETLNEGLIPMESLDIDDNLVVYLYGNYGATYDKNGTAVYFYDLRTKEGGLLSKRDGNQRNPSVSDGKIVWQDWYPDNRGLYLRYYDMNPGIADFSGNNSE